MLQTWQKGLRLVFSKRKYLWVFLLLLAVLLPVYAIMTDIILLFPLSLNPIIRPLNAALIVLTAVLASLGFAIAAYQLSEFRSISKPVGAGFAGAGASGGLLAMFASACTICQPIWLFWLGFGSASAFLADYSIYIVLASIFLLGYSIHLGLNAAVKGCKVKKGRK